MNQISVLLGFDIGTKRIGVAVGQMITKHAKPLMTLAAKDGNPDWITVDSLIKTWKPDALLVGVPLKMDDSVQFTTTLANSFILALQQRYALPTYAVDERLTTIEARDQIFRTGGYKALKKTKIDSVAAKIIVESWMAQQME